MNNVSEKLIQQAMHSFIFICLETLIIYINGFKIIFKFMNHMN